ncbi:hypothetical protein K439DRAFT_1525645 [Ramaria rubella]|nr:hypothetical protein K439DRAFT_1525645 [Ramaria rubella]
MAAILAKHASSITEWIEILTYTKYEVEAYDGWKGFESSSRIAGLNFKLRLLLASSANDLLTDVIKQLSSDPSTDPQVKKKLLVVLASWKCQFQHDSKMKLVTSLYDQFSQSENETDSGKYSCAGVPSSCKMIRNLWRTKSLLVHFSKQTNESFKHWGCTINTSFPMPPTWASSRSYLTPH